MKLQHNGRREIPFRLSRLCRCSNSSTSFSRSVFSVWVKISFTISRQSIPRQSLLSNSLNNDLTSWMLARLRSVMFLRQIEMSRSRSLSSSSTRIICSSKLLYSFLLHANFSTFSRRAHSSTPSKMAFNTVRRSKLRNPPSSNSSNNDKVGMLSSLRAANFPLHITSNCLAAFMLSSLWLIWNSKLLYSNSDILKQRLHLFY